MDGGSTKVLSRFALAALLMLVGAAFAHADPVGPSCANTPGGTTTGDPGDCAGDVYTLDVVSHNPTTNTYVVTLTDNTSGFDGTTKPGYVLAVSLQLSIVGGGTVSSSEVTLTSAPGTTSDWSSVMAGGSNSSGCNGTGNFFCVQLKTADQGASAPDKTGSTYTWTFDVTLPSGKSLSQATQGDTLKAVYFTANSTNAYDGVQTGAPITLQNAPEPATLGLELLGMMTLAFVLRRKFA